MSRIRGTGNVRTELRLITLFRSAGVVGWRRRSKLFGRPDFVFAAQKVTMFVDGCFWHRHRGCKHSSMPKSRAKFWAPKFEKNVARDLLVTSTLRKAGWKVIRVWECQLAPAKTPRALSRIRRALDKSPPTN
jgi:DNA mismatch endonuclease, patch repair protein